MDTIIPIGTSQCMYSSIIEMSVRKRRQSCSARVQGCQMVYFQTKNRNLGKFWRVLQWRMEVYFLALWSILQPFYIFYGHLVYFVVIWYIFPRSGIL
jgi:hypothetical protein